MSTGKILLVLFFNYWLCFARNSKNALQRTAVWIGGWQRVSVAERKGRGCGQILLGCPESIFQEKKNSAGSRSLSFGLYLLLLS